MELFRVEGGVRLVGQIDAGAAKNAVLPILAASLLASGRVRLSRCAHLLDIDNMLAILRTLGCVAEWDGNDIVIDPRDAHQHEMPGQLSKELRSSIFMLGPMLARFGKATFTYPGGCEIGLRPIDLHLKGLRALGADIREENGFIYCEGRLHGADVHLDYPSVGATENVLMAAVYAKGETVIHNAAQEPEVADLARFLCALGARIHGAGTGTVHVEGGHAIGAGTYAPMFDRIVTGTILAAAAATGGDVLVRGADGQEMGNILSKFQEMGCELVCDGNGIRLTANRPLRPLTLLETGPHPRFPTDMQSQMMALCCCAEGTSVIVENVFENRFGHVGELLRMGAQITVRDRTAIVRGVPRLHGGRVHARDLRAGAALVIAALSACTATEVENIRLIDRGYDRLDAQLRALGARIERL